MNLTLYTTSSPANAVTKTLSNASQKTGNMVNSTNDLIDPVVRLSGNIGGYNYVQMLGRYYFIRRTDRTKTGFTDLYLHEDVLMTFRNSIRTATGHVVRSSSGQEYLHDEEFSTFDNRGIGILKFPQSLPTTPQYILITAGG